MNKSLLALLLVCAIAGMAYAAPYEVEEQEYEDTQQLAQLLKDLKTMKEMVKQHSTDQDARAQLWGTALRHAGHAAAHYLE